MQTGPTSQISNGNDDIDNNNNIGKQLSLKSFQIWHRLAGQEVSDRKNLMDFELKLWVSAAPAYTPEALF